MLSLGPGAPSPAYFPFQNINYEVPEPETLNSDAAPEARHKVQAGKYDTRNGISNFDLSIALQYGQGTGSAQFLEHISDHVKVCSDLQPISIIELYIDFYEALSRPTI